MTSSLAVSRPFAGFSYVLGIVAAAIVVAVPPSFAQTAPPGPRDLPARSVPVPDTVSPQMQKIIAAPLTPTWNVIPKSAEEWKAQVNEGAAAAVQALPALREQLHVKVEPRIIDGVKTYLVTPETIPAQNRNRLLIHVHGGCYVSFPGESGTSEAVLVAGLGGFRRGKTAAAAMLVGGSVRGPQDRALLIPAKCVDAGLQVGYARVPEG